MIQADLDTITKTLYDTLDTIKKVRDLAGIDKKLEAERKEIQKESEEIEKKKQTISTQIEDVKKREIALQEKEKDLLTREAMVKKESDISHERRKQLDIIETDLRAKQDRVNQFLNMTR